MRFLIKALLVLIASAALVTLLGEEPGYVLVRVAGYTIETSAALAGLVLLVAGVVVGEGVTLLAGLLRFPRRWEQRQRQRRRDQARTLLAEGMLALERGRPQRARRLLVRGGRVAVRPAVFFMEASRAASMAGDSDRAETYLERAQQHSPAHESALTLLRAEQALDEDRVEHARAFLAEAAAKEPENPRVLRLLLPVLRRLEDWQGLLDVLPKARKGAIIPEVEARDELLAARGQRMAEAQASGEDAEVDALWQGASKAERGEPEIVAPRIRSLIARGDGEAAEKLLGQTLKRRWDGDLMRLYAVVPRAAEAPGELLVRLERWLDQHGGDPDLVLVLAELAVHAQLWGKADRYLEEALALANQPERLLRLAGLFRERNRPEEALTCLERARQGEEAAAGLTPPNT